MAIIYNCDYPVNHRTRFYCEECGEFSQEVVLTCAHGTFAVQYDDDFDHLTLIQVSRPPQRRYLNLDDTDRYRIVAEVPKLRRK